MTDDEQFDLPNKRLDKIVKRLDELWVGAKDVLTFEQAHKYLGISPSQLYKLTHARAIAAYKPGGKLLYFRRADLDGWVLNARVKTKKELTAAALSKLHGNKREV